MSFDEVDEIPQEVRQLGVPLHELKRCIDDRAAHIILPVTLTGSAGAAAASFGPRRAVLGFLGEYSLGLVVIDHRHGVVALALRGAIETRRQIGPIFRFVGGLRYLRWTWEIAREPIFATGKLDPFLGERRSGNRHG